MPPHTKPPVDVRLRVTVLPADPRCGKGAIPKMRHAPRRDQDQHPFMTSARAPELARRARAGRYQSEPAPMQTPNTTHPTWLPPASTARLSIRSFRHLVEPRNAVTNPLHGGDASLRRAATGAAGPLSRSSRRSDRLAALAYVHPHAVSSHRTSSANKVPRAVSIHGHPSRATARERSRDRSAAQARDPLSANVLHDLTSRVPSTLGAPSGEVPTRTDFF